MHAYVASTVDFHATDTCSQAKRLKCTFPASTQASEHRGQGILFEHGGMIPSAPEDSRNSKNPPAKKRKHIGQHLPASSLQFRTVR